jgi:CheY-like chemotaxis protein
MDNEWDTLEPDDLSEQTREVLAHFYDYAYLMGHPLVARYRCVGEDATLAVQRVRKLLLGAIEQLRPTAEVPQDDAAWRPYAALYQRYILGKDTAELESELSLGRRQLQREQRRGLRAVAATLSHQEPPSATVPSDGARDDALLTEIDRTSSHRQVFDAGEHLERALVLARAIADTHHVSVSLEPPDQGMLVVGNPVVFRQALLSALSAMVRSETPSSITISLERSPKSVSAVLRATLDPERNRTQLDQLPDTLMALVASLNGTLLQDTVGGCWQLGLRLPSSDWVPVVAVVEDNKDLVSLLSRYMASHGYRLVDAGPSNSACERIGTIVPDAIVLDVMMSDVDGWEVLQRIRSHPRLGGIPVAVCSVLDEPELARCLGASAYLRKPIRPVQFLECVIGLLG